MKKARTQDLTPMDEAEVREALAKGRPAAVYLLLGDDAAGKASLLETFEQSLEEGLRAFDYERFYADEPQTEVADIVAAARTLPMMAPRRLVVVMRAEVLFKPKGRAAAAEEDADQDAADAGVPGSVGALEEYLAAPSPETCLVVVAADVNRSLRQTKALLEVAAVVEYWGLKGQREAKGAAAVREAYERGGQYAVSQLREAGLAIDRAAIGALIEHAGTDMGELRNVVEQLAIYAAGRQRVTLEDVQAVTRGTALVNDWALTDAVAAGATRDALTQLRLQLDEGRSPFQVLGMLGWWIRERLPAARERQVPSAIESLLKADLELKSSADQQIVLERFVVELCEGGPRSGPSPRWR
jgi:DNA polymerase-3 subunit delta